MLMTYRREMAGRSLSRYIRGASELPSADAVARPTSHPWRSLFRWLKKAFVGKPTNDGINAPVSLTSGPHRIASSMLAPV